MDFSGRLERVVETSWEVFKSTEEAEGNSFAGPHA